MSFQERNVAASILVGLVFLYFLYTGIHVPLRDDGADAVGGFSGMAWSTLKLIGWSILGNIAFVIVFNILYAIVTNTEDPSTLVDERDQQIEYDGDRFGTYLTGVLFIAALFAAAYDWSPEWVLLLIVYGFFAGSFLSGLIRLFHHRRGY